MSLGPSSDKTESSQTSPWGPQADALTQAFQQAQNAYQQTQSGGAAKLPTDFTAGANQNQQNTYQQAIDFSNGNAGTAQSQIGAGQTAMNSGQTNINNATTGLNSFNSVNSNNPQSLIDAAKNYASGQDIPSQVKLAMQGATEQARDVTMPGITQAATNSGNANSSRAGIADGLVQRGLAEQSANLSGTLQSQAFQNGLTLAQQQAQNNNVNNLTALSQQGNLGVNSFNSGNTGVNSGVTNESNVLNIGNGGGTGQQNATQANLTNQLQQYQQGQTAPYTSLQQLMGIIGSQNWGSNSTGTSHTESDPGVLGVLGGLLGTASGVKKLF
jgi:hypothetical protein